MKLHGADFEIGAFQVQRSLFESVPLRVIFDIGANVGNTAAAYRSTFPEAEVYAFEPYGPVFERLTVRFAEDGQVHPFKLAMGRHHEVRPLYVNEYVDTNSLLPRPSNRR